MKATLLQDGRISLTVDARHPAYAALLAQFGQTPLSLSQAKPQVDDAPDDGDAGEFLAETFALIFNHRMQQGEPPTEDELTAAKKDLTGLNWHLTSVDGVWQAHRAGQKPVSMSAHRAPKGYTAEHPLRIMSQERGQEMAYIGGQWIPSSEWENLAQQDPATAQAILEGEQRDQQNYAAQADQRRQRGPADVNGIRGRTEFHKQTPISEHENEQLRAAAERRWMGNVKRAFSALKNHHGDLVLHRIEEIEGMLREALENTPEDEEGKRLQFKQRLRAVHHWVEMATDEAGKHKISGEPKPAGESLAGKPYHRWRKTPEGGFEPENDVDQAWDAVADKKTEIAYEMARAIAGVKDKKEIRRIGAEIEAKHKPELEQLKAAFEEARAKEAGGPEVQPAAVKEPEQAPELPVQQPAESGATAQEPAPESTPEPTLAQSPLDRFHALASPEQFDTAFADASNADMRKLAGGLGVKVKSGADARKQLRGMVGQGGQQQESAVEPEQPAVEPEQGDPVSTAAAKIQSIADRATDPALTYGHIDAAMQELASLDKQTLEAAAKAAGMTVKERTKKATLDEIRRRLRDRKGSWERIQFRPDTPAAAQPQEVTKPAFDPANHIKIAADSIGELRKQDVDRVLTQVLPENQQAVADYVRQNRPDLAGEVDEVLSEPTAAGSGADNANGPDKPGTPDAVAPEQPAPSADRHDAIHRELQSLYRDPKFRQGDHETHEKVRQLEAELEQHKPAAVARAQGEIEAEKAKKESAVFVPKNLTDAAGELQAVRNDHASAAADDSEKLLARVDAVGKWLAEQKPTAKNQKLIQEAHQLADKLRGGSGKGGVRLEVNEEQPEVRQEFVDSISQARETDKQFNGGGRYEAEVWMNLHAKHPDKPLPTLSKEGAEYVKDVLEGDGKPVPEEVQRAAEGVVEPTAEQPVAEPEAATESPPATESEQPTEERNPDHFHPDLSSVKTEPTTTDTLGPLLNKESSRYDFLKTAQETGYATDGRFLMKMTPDDKQAIDAMTSLNGRNPIPLDRLQDSAINQPIKPEPVTVAGARAGENGAEYLVESPSGQQMVVDGSLYETIRSRYPDATVHMPKRKGGPLVFRHDDETVGVMMPLGGKRFEGQQVVVGKPGVATEQPVAAEPGSAPKVSNDFVDEFFNHVHRDSLDSERFKSMPKEQQDELVASAKAKSREELEKLAQRIADKDPKLAATGAFHPSNKMYRKLFEQQTGVKLPTGAGATKKAVEDFIGKDRVEAHHAEKQRQQDEETRVKQDKEDAKTKERMGGLSDKVTAGDAIGGADLVDLAKHLGIPVHPRTAGTLNKRVSWIKDGQASIQGGKLPSEAYSLYQKVKQKLAGGEAAPEVSAQDSAEIPAEQDRITQQEGEAPNQTVTHEHVAGQGEAGIGGGVSAEQPLGSDAAEAPATAVPDAGAGVTANERPGGVPSGNDEQRDGLGRAAGGPGDAAGRGAGTGDVPATADAAGGTEPDGTVGVGGSGGRSGVGDTTVSDKPPEVAVAEEHQVEAVRDQPPSEDNPTDVAAGNWRYTSTDFAKGGLKEKFRNNIEAIRTLKQMQAEGRTSATAEEQAILSKYVGWGQMKQLFSYYENDWRKEREEFQSLVSGDEYEAARLSTVNAHYTHPEIVEAHWKMAERLGFKKGKFLETSAGIGYYLGMMPQHIAAKTRTSAVELDHLTGNMLQHLYPAANVNVQGFQDYQAPKGFYDLVASNFPFDIEIYDKDYAHHTTRSHDYFFLKSADLTAPGGLIMGITSTGTMDKGDGSVLAELAKTCDLVSAIRFPGGAHQENAGTAVVTDMLILRKRLPGEQPGDQGWTQTTTVPDPDGGEPIPVNKYFADHPEQILGRLDRSGTMRAAAQMNVSAVSPEDLTKHFGRTVEVEVTDDDKRRFVFENGSPVPAAEVKRIGQELFKQRLQAAIERLPENITKPSTTPKNRLAPEAMPKPGQVKVGGYHIQDGKLYRHEGDGMVEQSVPAKALPRIQGQLAIRDAIRQTLNEQLEGKDATESRARLNALYDTFVKKHGLLHDKANRKLMRGDPDAPVLLSMERKYDPKTSTAVKADMFVRPEKHFDKAENVSEGLGISLHETGGVDVDHIAKLMGKTPDAIGKELVEKGLAFQDPTEGWTHADNYLSGNVRQKLALAKAAAAADPRYAPNVAALEKVQPEDVHHLDINVKLGAPWVPSTDVAAFAAHLLGSHPDDFKVGYLGTSATWHFDYSRSGDYLARSNQARVRWGTPRVKFDALLEAALNNTAVKVFDTEPDGSRVMNVKATEDAMGKIQEMKEAFKGWVWTDEERRQRLHRHYNDNYNNIRHITYNGSHLTFPGMNPSIRLREHQKNFVWQVIATGKGLAAHEVGTGKTLAMIASAMELRRLGLARKPAIACTKSTIEAITAAALHAYPGAKIISTNDMFDGNKRKQAISAIATGDYDMVLLTHDHLDLLQMKPENTARFIKEEIAELEKARIASARENPKKDNKVVAALEKAKEKLKAKLQEALNPTKKDDAVYFEETGIDTLFVDEAHNYKSLPCYTKQEIKGIPQGRSDRATAMQMRTRWLMQQNNGRGVVFATGTPVGNTMAELYNMQRYLQPNELKERGLEAFDAWSNMFADTETKQEVLANGQWGLRTRMSNFVNIPELMQLSRQFMDVQQVDRMKPETEEDKIVRPKRKGKVHVAPQSPALAAYMKKIVERSQNLRRASKDNPDNMLLIGTDGTKASIDMRMVDVSAKDDPNSKANVMVANVIETAKANPGKTQLIFSDMGVNPMQNGFHLYPDIINKLVAGGIPREKIANFAELDGAAKAAAEQGLRDGTILVGIGSTHKLGTGVNVQDKLLALHHLDAPYTPAEMEQREGRAWRQGNENEQIQVHRYVTTKSLDTMRWQILARKAKFIKQVMGGDSVGRDAKEEDAEELTYEQVMAASAGDKRVVEKVHLSDEVRRLEAAHQRHEREKDRYESELRHAKKDIPEKERQLELYRGDTEYFAKHPDFSLELDGKTYTERKEAQAALEARMKPELERMQVDRWHSPDISFKYRGVPVQVKNVGFAMTLPESGREITSWKHSLQSLEALPKRPVNDADELESLVKKQKESIGVMEDKLKEPFARLDELKKKQARVAELEKSLSGEYQKQMPDWWEKMPKKDRANLLRKIGHDDVTGGEAWESLNDDTRHAMEHDYLTDVNDGTYKIHAKEEEAKPMSRDEDDDEKVDLSQWQPVAPWATPLRDYLRSQGEL